MADHSPLPIRHSRVVGNPSRGARRGVPPQQIKTIPQSHESQFRHPPYSVIPVPRHGLKVRLWRESRVSPLTPSPVEVPPNKSKQSLNPTNHSSDTPTPNI